jgi:hypothetical protein
MAEFKWLKYRTNFTAFLPSIGLVEGGDINVRFDSRDAPALFERDLPVGLCEIQMERSSGSSWSPPSRSSSMPRLDPDQQRIVTLGQKLYGDNWHGAFTE